MSFRGGGRDGFISPWSRTGTKEEPWSNQTIVLVTEIHVQGCTWRAGFHLKPSACAREPGLKGSGGAE